MDKLDHQFSLFDYSITRPTIKVPISAERIRAVKEMMERGNLGGAAEQMREVRYRLERFERRLKVAGKEVANG